MFVVILNLTFIHVLRPLHI